MPQKSQPQGFAPQQGRAYPPIPPVPPIPPPPPPGYSTPGYGIAPVAAPQALGSPSYLADPNSRAARAGTAMRYG